MKNRYLAAFAFAGLIGAGACAAEEENVQFDETPTFEETAPAPEITPAPTTGDTMMMPPEADTTIVDGVDGAVETDSVIL